MYLIFSCYILLLIKLFYCYLDCFFLTKTTLITAVLTILACTSPGQWPLELCKFSWIANPGKSLKLPSGRRPLGPWDPILSWLFCFFDALWPAITEAAKESAFSTTTHIEPWPVTAGTGKVSCVYSGIPPQLPWLVTAALTEETSSMVKPWLATTGTTRLECAIFHAKSQTYLLQWQLVRVATRITAQSMSFYRSGVDKFPEPVALLLLLSQHGISLM